MERNGKQKAWKNIPYMTGGKNRVRIENTKGVGQKFCYGEGVPFGISMSEKSRVPKPESENRESPKSAKSSGKG